MAHGTDIAGLLAEAQVGQERDDVADDTTGSSQVRTVPDPVVHHQPGARDGGEQHVLVVADALVLAADDEERRGRDVAQPGPDIGVRSGRAGSPATHERAP